MSWIKNIEKWGDEHHPKWLDIVRILLGVLIFVKGAQYMNHTEAMDKILSYNVFDFLPLLIKEVIKYSIIFAHLLGGVMITFGMLTRTACISLIPIMICAIIFVNIPELKELTSDLWLSLITLIMLVFFLVEGSGPISFDGWIRSHPPKPEWRPKDE